MADYKRMVSYMYLYENGVKRKNVGFARVEAKGGQCKITLHIQLLGQLDSIFPTYLIQRGNNNTRLIYLGDTLLKNQIMDSRLSADENNIMDSGYALSEMGGLLLFLNDNVFFATEWDDKPITIEEVLEALRVKDDKPKVPEDSSGIFRATSTAPAEAEPEANGEIFDAESMGTAEKQRERTLAEEFKQPEKILEKEFKQPQRTLEEELKMPRYKLPGGWKMVERLQKPYASNPSIDVNEEKEIMEPETENQGIEYVIGENKEKKNKGTEEFDTAEYVAETPDVKNQNTGASAEVFHQDNQDTIRNVDGTEQGRDIDGSSCSEEDNMQPDHPTANRFFENYPRIYPFEDNEIILCVKIEPKDISLLPKELWPLGNNSFLMHGYYCYHHLIFAKMKNRFGCRYMIGIPGIYHSREQFMAKMFGFESFKSIRKRELKQGDFGYWYLPVYF